MTAEPLTPEEEAALRAQDEALVWTVRRGDLWVKRMTEDWQTPYPEEVAVHRLLATLDAARKSSPPLDVERVLWADHLTTDHPTTPCYHDRAKVVMPGRVEAVAREYAALDPTP